MPRRIIYIKNPSSGSHFRTIGGDGGSSKPKTSKPPKPITSSNPQFGLGAVGYGGNYTQGAPSWENWYNTFPNTTQIPAEVFTPAGNQPAGTPGYVNIFSGLTPQQFYGLQWEQHTGIDFWIWYAQTLAEGIDPTSGMYQPALGTPGQLLPPRLFYDEILRQAEAAGYSRFHPDGTLYNQFTFGGINDAPASYPAFFGSAYQKYIASLGAP